MTWTETNRRQQVLREVRAVAAVRLDGELPWSDDYADAYGDPAELLRDLAYFWRLQVEAQVDPGLDEVGLEDRRGELFRQNEGVLRILDAHDASPFRREHELAA